MVFNSGYVRTGFMLAALMLSAACTKTPALSEAAQPSEPRISESELRAYCPRVALPDRDAFYTVYERGGEEDPKRIIYQVAIDKVTRACRYAGQQITMEVAAAGRVVPGPKFNVTSLNLPLYVRAQRGAEVLYEKTQQLAVSALARGEAAQFLFKDEAVVFEQPTARNVQIFVGFHRPRT